MGICQPEDDGYEVASVDRGTVQCDSVCVHLWCDVMDMLLHVI